VENNHVLINAFTHMICEHLRPLEQAMLARGIRETFRGQAWSMNCREWVYFDCFIDAASVRASFAMDDCVYEHLHRGTHDGQEASSVLSVTTASWEAMNRPPE